MFILINTPDLQDEVAEKIADIWDAGFEFVYFDGSEGVNPPFWYHVSGAQWRVFSKLKPEPIFAEGAAKTHFSWHMLTGGNAFDVFSPEVLKEETVRHPFKEAPRMQDNFTRINFGWLGYWVPDEKTVGTQPDHAGVCHKQGSCMGLSCFYPWLDPAITCKASQEQRITLRFSDAGKR